MTAPTLELGQDYWDAYADAVDRRLRGERPVVAYETMDAVRAVMIDMAKKGVDQHGEDIDPTCVRVAARMLVDALGAVPLPKLDDKTERQDRTVVSMEVYRRRRAVRRA